MLIHFTELVGQHHKTQECVHTLFLDQHQHLDVGLVKGDQVVLVGALQEQLDNIHVEIGGLLLVFQDKAIEEEMFNHCLSLRIKVEAEVAEQVVVEVITGVIFLQHVVLLADNVAL